MARTERRRHAVARLGRLLLASGSLTSVLAFSAEPTRPRESAPAATPAPAGRRPLDLRAPDVRRLLPAEQWRYPLPGEDESVTVEARRKTPPLDAEKAPVPGGIIAPFWALRHPTKAWRIFVPDPNVAASGPPDPVPTLKSIQKQ